MKNLKQFSSVQSIELINDEKLNNIVGGRNVADLAAAESTWGDSTGTECVKDDGKSQVAHSL